MNKIEAGMEEKTDREPLTFDEILSYAYEQHQKEQSDMSDEYKPSYDSSLLNELGNYVSDFKAKAMKESNAADEAGEKGFFCYDEIEGD